MEFLKVLEGINHKGYLRVSEIDKETTKVIDYLSSLESKTLRRIFSDPYWVRYKFYRVPEEGQEFDDPIADQLYGYVLRFIVLAISERTPKMFSILKSYSKGIILYYALEFTSGKELLKVAKRAKKDKDYRVRLKAVRTLPRSQIKDMTNDSSGLVRDVVWQKLGPISPELFLDCKDRWTNLKAKMYSSLDKFDWESYMEDFRKNVDTYPKWKMEVRVAESILRRMPEEELLFYVDLTGVFESIDKVFTDRLNNKWS